MTGAGATPRAGPTVVVPAWGRPDTTRLALRSLLAEGAAGVLLVDDEGRGHGAELAREFPTVELLATREPAYWTGAIRLGAAHALAAGAPAVLFFNQDVVLSPGYLERLAATAARFPGAVIGSVVLYAGTEGLVWSAGARMEWFGRGFRVLHHGDEAGRLPLEPYPVDWLFGMGTYVPASVFERIGLPDAARFPMAWGDADFTLRARAAGIPVLIDPALRLVHEVGEYDPRVARPPGFATYVSWLRSPLHNVSLSAQREVWRRHGPKRLWRLSYALRVLYLLANFARVHLLHRTRPTASGGAHC